MTVFILFVVGLCFGSFVNALVWRLKKKRNWISERSECTHCHRQLATIDLLPAISWLLLRGKCRYCQKKIDDSPLTELSVAFLFVISYLAWPYGFDGDGWFRLVVWLVAFVLLAAMFLYDLKWMILPDKLTYALGGLAAVQLIVLFLLRSYDFELLKAAPLSIVLGGGLFHLLFYISKGKYIGGGDVKLGYAYGLLFIDPLMSWLVITIASVLGSFIAIALIVFGKAKLSSKLPFGPMLIVGIVIVMLWGQRLWDLTSRWQ